MVREFRTKQLTNMALCRLYMERKYHFDHKVYYCLNQSFGELKFFLIDFCLSYTNIRTWSTDWHFLSILVVENLSPLCNSPIFR
ncbi:hypothetical protein BpHYR1_009897 [Brachionus plicatilis]|uniref:Uncharacterized protein n=1 Tax=Brachionus plicatilis TaxID=10195 RepID=A0A3M7QJL7_BRAPC|nr:hypothetical protein BpHYR1_009897 [Brachionus plicatilis]